eukprot:s172_g28.t1
MAPKGRSNVTLVTSASQWRKIAQSLFDYEKLEWTLGGNTRQPFTSKTFLSKKVDGAIFGTEFEAQAAAPEEKRQRVSFSSVVLKAGLLSSYMDAWSGVAKDQARKHRKEQRREAVQLALEKWTRGATQGLLHEILRLWHKRFVKRNRHAWLMSNYLVKWEEQAEVGIAHTCYVAWKKVADASARKRLMEHGKENVKLAVEKFLLGNLRGLVREVVREWYKASVERRQKVDMVKKSLVAWEEETGVGILKTCTSAWKRLVDAISIRRNREHGKEAVKLALEKWERGDQKGLLHEAITEWHKLAVVRGRKAAMMSNFLVSWEMEAEVGLLHTCHSAWRRLAQANARQQAKERGREAVQVALAKWERGNVEGLLQEIVRTWHHASAKGRQKAKVLDRCLIAWESKAGVALRATFLAVWRQTAAESSKRHAKQRGREAVELALQKWERGNVQGLLHEIVIQWHHSSTKGRQKAKLLDRCLIAWESKAGVALRATFLAVWRQTAAASSNERRKKQSREAVELALQKWERGNVNGLLHECLDQWHRLAAKRKQQDDVSIKRFLLAWESKTGVGLLGSFFKLWREEVDAVRKERLKKKSQEAVHLAMQKHAVKHVVQPVQAAALASLRLSWRRHNGPRSYQKTNGDLRGTRLKGIVATSRKPSAAEVKPASASLDLDEEFLTELAERKQREREREKKKERREERKQKKERKHKKEKERLEGKGEGNCVESAQGRSKDRNNERKEHQEKVAEEKTRPSTTAKVAEELPPPDLMDENQIDHPIFTEIRGKDEPEEKVKLYRKDKKEKKERKRERRERRERREKERQEEKERRERAGEKDPDDEPETGDSRSNKDARNREASAIAPEPGSLEAKALDSCL